MPITYDPQHRLFKLDTNLSTYAFMVYEENYLVHLYYGAKIPDTDLSYLMYRSWFSSQNPYNPNIEDPRFSPDIAPMEYATNGAGDFRISACSVRGENGDTVTDLRYVSHRILPGKPKLPGLPATFAGEDEAQTLELETVDSVTGVRAFLLYTVFEEYGVITRSVRFENRGSAPVELERAYSACVDFPGMDFDMVHLYGRWAKENSTARHPLQHGIQSIQSKRGMTGPNHNPFVALCRHTATGRTLPVLTKYLRRRGEQEWCEDTSDYRLAVEPGDRLSIVEETSRGRLVKKDGVTGWYFGRLKGPEREEKVQKSD